MIQLLLTVLLAFPSASAAGHEHIPSYTVDIRHERSGRTHIREEIVYDFGSREKHGIFRFIPLGNHPHRLGYMLLSVEMDGAAVPYEAEREGRVENVKIGDPVRTITGRHTYVLEYEIRDNVVFGADEAFAWNAVGTDWPVPVDTATATLRAEGITAEELRAHAVCYTGLEGSRAKACTYEIAGDALRYTTTEPLGPNEGLEIETRFPAGTTTPPPLAKRLLGYVLAYGGFILPFLALAYCMHRYLTSGRDPAGRGTIVAEYDAPDGLRPAEIGTIVDERADPKDIAATIIDLAVRGNLVIEETEKPGLFGGSTDYTFRSAKREARLAPFEQTLLDGLFTGRDAVALSALKEKFATTTQKIQKDLYRGVTEKGYFTSNPETARAAGYGIAGLLAFAGFFLFGFLPWSWACGLIAAGIVIALFSHSFAQRTAAGVAIREKTLGLKEYMRVAEKDRMEFDDAPKRYATLLPYALALGVVASWSKKFEGLLKNPPDWYRGSNPSAAFNPVLFGSSLSNFSSSTASTFTSTASSSGGGGGGSSGGGGGGGGGGSW